MANNNVNQYPSSASASYNPDAHVVLTQQEIEASRRHKAKNKTNINQVPVYRSVKNLNFIIAQVITDTPRKAHIVSQNLDNAGNQLLTTVALAYDDPAIRCDTLTEAIAITHTIFSKLQIIERLGYMSKDDEKKVRKVIDSICAQLAAWRSSVKREITVAK